MKTLPLVTVYMPNYNYENYIEQSIQSVIDQSYSNWELIIILDGVIDNSKLIIDKFIKSYPKKISVINNRKRKGLQVCANLALKKAKGKYFIRLDPDDYLNESALIVMTNYLENNKNISIVYPDYFYVDKKSNILDVDTRKKIGTDVNVFDLPAHGACTMIRTTDLEKIGGYSKKFSAQDGYDIWYNVLDKYNIFNISTPLFYYRQHNLSLTRKEDRILGERQKIKKYYASKKQLNYKLLFIIGAKNKDQEIDNIVLKKINKIPLIEYTLNEIQKFKKNSITIVNSDDDKVLSYLRRRYNKKLILLKRPNHLNEMHVTVDDIIANSLEEVDYKKIDYNIIVYLNVNSPLKKYENIREGIDTLILHDFEKVISVYEDLDLHFTHKMNGLEPISRRRHAELRIEREALYVDNRAFSITWKHKIKNASRNKKIGHVVMKRSNSLNIREELELFVAKKILSK